MKASITPHATAPTLGILAGLGGLTHAVGEMRQSSAAPDGVVFESWADGPIAANMGGDPAMSVIPHFFITGLVVALVSLALILWSITRNAPGRRGWGLVGLSVAMLLTGGGFGPPIIGALAGGSAIALGRSGSRAEDSPGAGRRALARTWPWIYYAAAGAATLLVVGSLVLEYGFDVENGDVFVGLFFLTVVFAALAIPARASHELTRQAAPLGRVPEPREAIAGGVQ
jgi:hypothetical protein